MVISWEAWNSLDVRICAGSTGMTYANQLLNICIKLDFQGNKTKAELHFHLLKK